MKIFSRVVALVLVIGIIAMLAACGGDDNQTTTTTSPVTTAAEQTSANDQTATQTATVTATNNATKTATATTRREVASITNIAGYSTIAPIITRTTNGKGNASNAFVKSLKGYKMTILQAFEQPKSGKIYESDKWCTQEVMKEYGIDIKLDGFWASYNDKLAANLASHSANNQVYMVQDFNFASWFKNGYLTDLTSAMNKAGVDFKDPWYNQNAREFLNINYKQYGWVVYGVSYTFPYGILYNKNLIKKAKLTDPETLVKSGKWTWATIEKYAKKLTNSNVVGFGCANLSQMFGSAVATKGSSLVKVKKGQEPTSNINAQVNLDIMAKISSWINNKICDTFSNKDWTYPKTTFAKAKIAMLYSSHDAFQHLYLNKSFKDSIGFVPFPTEKESKTYTNVSIPQFIWFIPTQQKADSAKILFGINELYRQQHRFQQRNFDINWRTYFDDKDTLDLACNMMYGRGIFKNVYDWRSVCETGKVSTGTVIKYAIDNNGAVKEAVTKYKDALDKCYSAVWKGYKVTGKV